MITEKEQNATLLSPVKKDFYQIWNELLETSKKLSERWDPTSTNESDPGIVLLKVLTACSDKLNYNIDKNILEAFMPSAAQEESMRKLCDMLGYSMKYYRSATTTATISFTGETDDIPSSGIYFPKYTNIKNTDETVNYITLEGITLNANKTSAEVNIMEGTLQECATETDNIITTNMLDDNYRYTLPESEIAENGIFVYNMSDSSKIEWEKVSNLNTIAAGKKVYKFGFNSKLGMPYIQFPEDVNNLIDDGLIIYYVRTNGVNGNISARTLTTFEKPDLWSDSDYKDTYSSLTTDMFYIVNANAATNGTNKETLNQAYNNYKKTIGTFDTLITCRDYINKIYQLTYSENNTTPLVSNIVVSDIKDDINRAITLCTFGEYGIKYIDKPITYEITRTATTTSGETVTIEDTENEINNFDLIFYPFKTVTGLNTKTEYKNSFKYNTDTIEDITTDIADYKTLSHNIKLPDDDEIVCIKNYLKLNARITTTSKINSIEAKEIISVIKTAIFENFNARNIDFGEEIPYDSILEVIDQADERIKNVSLEEPTLYTAFELADGSEYSVTSPFGEENSDEWKENKLTAKKLYNKLALRNILAGRIALFNYDKNFTSTYEEVKRTEDTSSIFPEDDTQIITQINGEFDFPAVEEAHTYNLDLTENEIIQFRSPNLKTTVTYPAYVNYYFKKSTVATDPAAAIFKCIGEYLKDENWITFITYLNAHKTDAEKARTEYTEIKDDTEFQALKNTNFNGVFIINDTDYKLAESYTAGTIYYTFEEIEDNLLIWRNWSKTILVKDAEGQATTQTNKGLYKRLAADFSRQIGEYVDSSLCKYILIQSPLSSRAPYESYYVQEQLGIDADNTAVSQNVEYQLQQEEYLLINYTKSETDSETSTTTETIINKYYGPGTIIKTNFDIMDSEKYYELGNKFPKTDGFNFTGLMNSGNSVDKDPCPISPNGLCTLSTNEQIEIREPIVITLNDKTDPAYIYFIKNNNIPGDDGYIYLFEGDSTSYTLKADEYFFYTDKNKLDIAYYGNGTTIKKFGNVDIKKDPNDDDISEQEISEQGLDVIPWVAYHFTSQSYINLYEYQYISITSGDTLISATIVNSDTEEEKENTWKVSTAEYKYADADASETLPAISYKIDGNSVYWEMASKLELNAGPSAKQSLGKYDKLVITYETGDTKTIAGDDESDPVSFKTNYYALSGDGEVVTTNNLYNSEGILVSKTDDETITDFKVKVFRFNEVVTETESGTSTTASVTVPLNNFGSSNWTKIVITAKESTEKYTALHLNVPYENSYALIMFYFLKKSFTEETSKKTGMYIKLTNNVVPTIFNNENSWWTDHSESGKYYFKEGINIVKISSSCDIEIYPSYNDSGKSDTIIFSNPDIIITSEECPQGTDLTTLQYYDTSETNDEEKTKEALSETELLAAINKVDTDHNFYYNNPIDNSTALEVNTSADPAETLATESIWYNYNNINNKFVISEIDPDYLDTGITIAKSSRLY